MNRAHFSSSSRAIHSSARMRLLDRAGPDDHRRDLRDFLEQPGFCSISDLGVVVAADKRLRQGDDVGVRRHVEAGKPGIDVEVDAGRGLDRLHGGFEFAARKVSTSRTSSSGSSAVDGAELEEDLAAVGDDVERRATLDHADMTGRIRDVVELVARSIARKRPAPSG